MAGPKQSTATLNELSERIWQYREERDWLGVPPRSLAVSILLEASELLEHYQWSDKPIGDKQALAEELADVFIYAFQFAQANDIDIAKSIEAKLQKIVLKYPADAFKGKQTQQKHDAWVQAKLKHRKQGL